MIMDARKALAEQIGLLLIANIEQSALITKLEKDIEQLGQRLHDVSEKQTPSGQVSPPDLYRGN